MSGRLVTGTSQRSRDRALLVALNTRLDLPRDAVIRLALRRDLWSSGGCVATGRLASRIGVARATLAEARALIADAERLADVEIRAAESAAARVVTMIDPDYPPALTDLELPPPVLYLRGRLPDAPGLAIVGSRRADDDALGAARTFARDLAASGMTVVSGLARGVDGAAHRGALASERGTTVAVQACGADLVYPRRHRGLAEEIAARGALVTEFPMGTEPMARNFPVRNRIIAALSLGTLVVQAARRSGTLITARLALELGREVWAIPGSIYHRRATGANELIRDGATIVLEPRDVLESLPLAVRDRLAEVAPPRDASAPAVVPEGPARDVLEALTARTSMAPDELAATTLLNVAEVLSALAQLELHGLVRRRPGPVFRVVRPP